MIKSAFSPVAAQGGFAGAAVWLALRYGVARGIFSNEAGLGSAPIAHAAAKTNDPVRQGMIAMLGTFIDTIIICSCTAFVILLGDVYQPCAEGIDGVVLTQQSLVSHMGEWAKYFLTAAILLFSFSFGSQPPLSGFLQRYN